MTMKAWLAAGKRGAIDLQRFRAVAAGLSLVREARPRPAAVFPSDTPHYDPELGIFTFCGTYREMGRQFAEVFPLADLLKRSRTYLRTHKETRSEIGRAKGLLETWHPQMRGWLQGIVDHHRQYDLDEAVLAAFCTVLADDAWFSSCSAVAVNHRGSAIVGQNLDLGRSCRLALIRLVPSSGMVILARVIVGYPWILAIANQAGLVVGGSSIDVNEAPRADGELLPQELLADLILSRARTVKEVVALLDTLPALGPLNGGVSLVFADKAGTTCHVEITGGKWVTNMSAEDVCVTTNHFRHPEMAPLGRVEGWMSERLLENSRARYEHARTFFREPTEADHDAVVALLRVSKGCGAWLRKARWPDLGYTTASYIIDGHDRTIEYWIGSGAQTSRRASIDDLLRR